MQSLSSRNHFKYAVSLLSQRIAVLQPLCRFQSAQPYTALPCSWLSPFRRHLGIWPSWYTGGSSHIRQPLWQQQNFPVKIDIHHTDRISWFCHFNAHGQHAFENQKIFGRKCCQQSGQGCHFWTASIFRQTSFLHTSLLHLLSTYAMDNRDDAISMQDAYTSVDPSLALCCRISWQIGELGPDKISNDCRLIWKWMCRQIVQQLHLASRHLHLPKVTLGDRRLLALAQGVGHALAQNSFLYYRRAIAALDCANDLHLILSQYRLKNYSESHANLSCHVSSMSQCIPYHKQATYCAAFFTKCPQTLPLQGLDMS